MRSLRIIFLTSLTFIPALASQSNDPNIAATQPRSAAEERTKFILPPGFEIQLVAAEPEIHKPLNIAFDDRGRLWVSDTIEYPFAAKDKPRDTVKILDDFGPDGRARKITTFAGELNIPIGVLPLPTHGKSEALVYSIPNIWHISEDGKRTIAYREYGHRDTHGMTSAFTMGFDGWIYACHGFANDSEVRGSDGNAVKMNSGNTYRFKPDGTHAEAHTRGQVNPFGLCFDPLGNLYSADCHSQPIYQLLKGGYYPSFGKPHDGLGFAPEMFTEYKDSTAIAGLSYYAADHFPPAFRDCAYIGDVVTNRIVQFAIDWHGSTPKARMSYFLKSDDPWFRPVDIKLGPDGALYVADFYNRIIGHYEVPLDHPGRDRERGRIWRIVWKGTEPGTPAPRKDFSEANTEQLIADLRHPNMTVRMLATNQLAARGAEVVPQIRSALDQHLDGYQAVHGLWLLQRLGASDVSLLENAAKSKDRAVRVHTQRILEARSPWSAGEHRLALAALADPDANVVRAAAQALGQHPAADNVASLLKALHAATQDDTHLTHVLRIALRDQLSAPGVYAALPILRLGNRDVAALADVSLGVPSAPAATFLFDCLQGFGANNAEERVHHIARHGDASVTKQMITWCKATSDKNIDQQIHLVQALQRGTQERGAAIDSALLEWAEQLTGDLLNDDNDGRKQAGLDLIAALHLGQRAAQLAALATDPRVAEPVRAAGLAALSSVDPNRASDALSRVLNDANAPFGLRERSIQLLAQSNSATAQDALVAALATAPARLQDTIAVGLAGGKPGAERLLTAVADGKASARLLLERAVAVKLEATQPKQLKERLATLTAGLPPADQKMQELLQRRRTTFLAAKPDVVLGRKVFEKSCAICHQLGGQGAKVGPQLDGVGVRGLERLLEDTLDPNRNVDQAFRLTTLQLKKGQIVSGLVLNEEGAVVVLADNQGKEVRIEKSAIEERTTSQQSPMPADFAEQIPEADFQHLLAYLLQQRVGKP